MEIQGRIKWIGQSEIIGSNGFEKRDLVITTQEQYPQHIIIQFTQGRCVMLDNLQIGQLVNVHFNLRGREWINPQGEVKYFNTLEGWKIEVVQVTNVANPSYQNPVGTSRDLSVQNGQPPMGYAPTPSQAPQYQQTSAFDSYGQAPTQSEVEDDLPF